jgi:squalene-associated FAD-dependent desaturase
MLDCDVVIIGGGVAGLACAMGLAGSDLAVTVLERADRLGGRAASFHDETTGDTVDTGPHVVYSHYRNLLALLEWVGTDSKVIWQDNPLRTIADGARALDIRNAPLPPPLHIAPSMLTIPALSVADKLSSVPVAVRAMSFDESAVQELDDRTAFEFLRECGTSARLMQWFWATASMTMAALPLEQCSAGALLRFYRQLIGHPDVRIGLPSVPLDDLLSQPARRLVEHNDNRVRIGAGVRALHGTEDRIDAVELDDGLRLCARHVVLAVPPAEVAAFGPWADGRPIVDELELFTPSPYVSCYLWFDRKVTGLRCWTRTALSRPMNFDWYDLSNFRSGSDGGSIIASNIVYAPRIGTMSDDAIIDATRRELAEFAPAANNAQLRHARVHRVPMSIPCARPGVERRRPGTRSRIANLYLAGDWTATGLPFSMESAARSGLLAAEAVRYDADCPQPLAHCIAPPCGLTGLVRRAQRDSSPPGVRVKTNAMGM